jgi:hypothetical protein
MLLVVAAASTELPRWRAVVRVLALVLLAAGVFNNARQLTRAAEAARDLATQRLEVKGGLAAPPL